MNAIYYDNHFRKKKSYALQVTNTIRLVSPVFKVLTQIQGTLKHNIKYDIMIFTIHYSNSFGFQVLLKRVFVIDHRVVYVCLMHPANFIICAHITPRTTSLTRQ